MQLDYIYTDVSLHLNKQKQMIKFFRRIRQKLLSENRVSKYLLYALGEIALVMIGILLALQVNEWNNERNRIKEEQVIIEQLIADLSKSQYELEDIERYNLRRAREYSRVLRMFWKYELPEDAADSLAGYGSSVYSPVQGTAISLINSGRLDILSSKELKNDIVTYVETIGYTLKDINRYEEAYLRNGIDLYYKVMPNTFESKQEINKRGEQGRKPFGYSQNLNRHPLFVDKVPFKTDIKQLFEDERFYRANRRLRLYHRNISRKYNQLLNITNELLANLYKASNKHQELGKQLSNSQHYLVFEPADLEILQLTDDLLSDSAKWNKNDDRECDDDKVNGNYSLNCAMVQASEEVVGSYDSDALRPAIRMVLFTLKKYENKRVVGRIAQEWNNHPDTKFEELKQVLKESIDEVKKQIQ